MKKIILTTLTVLFAVYAFAGCAGPAHSPESENAPASISSKETSDTFDISNSGAMPNLSDVSAASAPGNRPDLPVATAPGKIPDSSFSKEDWKKLLTLAPEGYEDMTVSDFREHIAILTDTVEYRELLERVSKSETLYALRDIDETAAFLYYVLEPLTAERWQARDYNGQADSGFPYPEDNARIEYVFTLTILNPETLTVGEYNAKRLAVINGMQNIIKGKTREELQDTEADSMTAALSAETEDLVRRLQTEDICISIEYAYFPLFPQNDSPMTADPQKQSEEETRRYRRGTKEDYHSLLSLKTADYQNMPLADFNAALLDWANENPERMERVSEDAGWDDFQVSLTDEELIFVKQTVFLSGMENGKAVQALYTGAKPENPCYAESLPQRTAGGSRAAWCSLYYQFSYSISDPETVTVGERDRRIAGMTEAVHAFWNDTAIERLLKMAECDIVSELQKIAAAHSTDHIVITTSENQVHFECMDERFLIY